MVPYATPTIALLVIGFVITGYLMVLRPWLAARRQPGMTLRFPIVSWLRDACRRDLAALQQEVDRQEALVTANQAPPRPVAPTKRVVFTGAPVTASKPQDRQAAPHRRIRFWSDGPSLN